MNRLDDNIPLLFIEYQKKLKDNIYSLGLTQKYVYDGIGMGRTTWQRRIKECSFNAIEIMNICKLVNK